MKKNKVVLNLGCGDATMPNAINIDSINLPNVNMVLNLEKFPYPFKENSVDEIHLYFVLEHLVNHLGVMQELYRILKKGGVLYIRVPHGSSIHGGWGEFTHQRGYCWGSFDIFSDTSKRAYYSNVRFKTLKKRCKYFLTYPYDFYKYNTWIPSWEKAWYAIFIKAYVNTVQFLIDLSPVIFERFWLYWVGGAAEVYVELKKV